MTCPSCQVHLASPARRCPRCGVRIVRMESGIVKTSVVLIASHDVRAMYPSLNEVPEPLRTRVLESTRGRNSGTIVIADRRGKEEIEKAARFERISSAEEPARRERPDWHRIWPGLVALIVGAAGAWLAIVIRW